METSLEEQHYQVISIIAEHFIDQSKNGNILFALEDQENQYNSFLKSQKMFLDEEKRFLVERLSKIDVLEPNVSEGSSVLEQINSPIRQAEERFLRIKYFLPTGENSLESWAMIGMRLADKEPDSAKQILKELNGEKVTKRGRPKKSFSLDYERALWLKFLNAYKMGLDADRYLSGEDITVEPLQTSDVIKAYAHAFDHPDTHPYIWVFEKLDERLKIKSKSLNSLLTSFHRGEKERERRWKLAGRHG